MFLELEEERPRTPFVEVEILGMLLSDDRVDVVVFLPDGMGDLRNPHPRAGLKGFEVFADGLEESVERMALSYRPLYRCVGTFG